MPTKSPTERELELQRRIEELQFRLTEAEETFRAIHEGEVDAIVVSGSKGEQIFSLPGADLTYRLIAETMNEGALTTTLEGRILFCNNQFSRLILTPPEQIVGRELAQFVAPALRAALPQLIEDASTCSSEGRLVLLAKGGYDVPVYAYLNVLGQPDDPSICIVVTDLTKLENSIDLIRQMEQQQEALRKVNEELAAVDEEIRIQNEELNTSRVKLERTQARYLNLFEMAPDGYIVTDSIGTIQEVNRMAVRLFARPVAELIGQSISSLLTASEMNAYYGLLADLITGTTPPSWEVELRPREGPPFWSAITTAASRNEKGEIVDLRWLIRDVTQRKEAESALNRAALELERSNKDLEQFAYVASHDLQEPLRAVTGFLKLLRDRHKGSLDAKADEYIGVALDGASRMSSMIAELLAYSRVGSQGTLQAPVEFDRVVNHARANLQTAINECGAIITQDPLPSANGDAAQMSQVFQNLLGNALKFRSESRTPEIHVGARREGSFWIFHVRDNGIGIDPRYLDKLFQLFQRLHNRQKYSGFGIGLAVCKKIIERHGGRIWVESTPEVGSTVFFTLPA